MAMRWQGAFCNGKRIHVSSEPLENGLVILRDFPIQRRTERTLCHTRNVRIATFIETRRVGPPELRVFRARETVVGKKLNPAEIRRAVNKLHDGRLRLARIVDAWYAWNAGGKRHSGFLEPFYVLEYQRRVRRRTPALQDCGTKCSGADIPGERPWCALLMIWSWKHLSSSMKYPLQPQTRTMRWRWRSGCACVSRSVSRTDRGTSPLQQNTPACRSRVSRSRCPSCGFRGRAMSYFLVPFSTSPHTAKGRLKHLCAAR